jgi:hypothetical protein
MEKRVMTQLPLTADHLEAIVPAVEGGMALASCGEENRRVIRSLLEVAVKEVNAGVSQTLTARTSAERPPADTRHLTDTRTRVSTLLEYAVAYEMNNHIDSLLPGHTLSTVLWNVYPDLVVRDQSRCRVMGLEVKALHTAAEEKSANFDTPIQLVRKDSDFVLIMSWGWQQAKVDNVEIVYPHIHACEIFDAWLLAKIRDYTWMYRCRDRNGTRKKAFDLCSPIIDAPNSGGKFKAEEGNLGKLMRIGRDNTIPDSTPSFREMKMENELYQTFMAKVLAIGLRETFNELCLLAGCDEIGFIEFDSYPNSTTQLAKAKLPDDRQFVLLAGGRAPHGGSRAPYPDKTLAFYLTGMLKWTLLEANEGAWLEKGEGQKPDIEFPTILEKLDL